MGLDFGSQLMRSDAAKDARTREKAAQEESSKRGLFGSIGGLLGTFLPLALAPFTGGMSLAASAIVSGIGAAAGQAIGRNQGDKAVKDMYSQLDRMDQGAILKSGITSAVSAYMNPMMGSLSDKAAISHVTDGMKVGSEQWLDAVGGLDLRNPGEALLDFDMSTLPEGVSFGDISSAYGIAPSPFEAQEVLPFEMDLNLPDRSRIEPEPFIDYGPEPILPASPASGEFSDTIVEQGVGGDSPLFGPGYTGVHDVPPPTFNPDSPGVFTPRDLFVSSDAYDAQQLWNEQQGLLGLSDDYNYTGGLQSGTRTYNK